MDTEKSIGSTPADSPRKSSKETPRPSSSRILGIKKRIAAFAIGAAGALTTPADTSVRPEDNPVAPAETQETVRVESLKNSQPHLTALRESHVFPEGEEWATTGNAEAFSALGETLYDTAETRELFEKEGLVMLYPGSGVHLSPLETATQMAEKSETLKNIHIIYTEIDPKSYDHIDGLVKTYVDNTPSCSDFSVQAEGPETSFEEDENSPRKKTMTFTLTTSNKREVKITMDFEYKTSDGWFRKELGKEVDLIILHDVGTEGFSKTSGAVQILIENLNIPPDRKESVFAIIENDDEHIENNSGGLTNEPLYEMVGKVVAVQDKHPFGCGQNHWDDESRRAEEESQLAHIASVVKIDMKKITEIKKVGGESALRAFMGLYVLIGDKLPDVKDYEALEKVVQKTSFSDLKDEIRKVAEEKAGRWRVYRSDKENNTPVYQQFRVLQRKDPIWLD